MFQKTVCFNCGKKIGMFKPRGNRDLVIRNGYSPPYGMTEHDQLCQYCLVEIRNTQQQGKKYEEKVSVGWQIVLCLIFPLAAFLRIQKARKILMYGVIIVPSTMLLILLPVYYIENRDVATMLSVSAIFFLYIGMWVIPVYWVIKWSRDWNRINSIPSATLDQIYQDSPESLQTSQEIEEEDRRYREFLERQKRIQKQKEEHEKRRNTEKERIE